MTGTDLSPSPQAAGKPPILPTQIAASLSDTYLPWNLADCFRETAAYHDQIPGLASQMEAACQPCPWGHLTQRLTALGMMMAPNRPAAEATVWLHEMRRLLEDLPQDILDEAIDQCQRTNRFLPTVAEIMAIAEPLFTKRKAYARRLRAIADRLSGTPVDAARIEHQARLCRPDEAEEILRENGLLEAVRERQQTRQPASPLRKPTRQDYIEMGVDPAVLDSIAIPIIVE